MTAAVSCSEDDDNNAGLQAGVAILTVLCLCLAMLAASIKSASCCLRCAQNAFPLWGRGLF